MAPRYVGACSLHTRDSIVISHEYADGATAPWSPKSSNGLDTRANMSGRHLSGRVRSPVLNAPRLSCTELARLAVKKARQPSLGI